MTCRIFHHSRLLASDRQPCGGEKAEGDATDCGHSGALSEDCAVMRFSSEQRGALARNPRVDSGCDGRGMAGG